MCGPYAQRTRPIIDFVHELANRNAIPGFTVSRNTEWHFNSAFSFPANLLKSIQAHPLNAGVLLTPWSTFTRTFFPR
jgi:beta-xylosidase